MAKLNQMARLGPTRWGCRLHRLAKEHLNKFRVSLMSVKQSMGALVCGKP